MSGASDPRGAMRDAGLPHSCLPDGLPAPATPTPTTMPCVLEIVCVYVCGWDAGNAWGAEPWERPLPHPAGPYTTALLKELERIEERTHWRDL